MIMNTTNIVKTPTAMFPLIVGDRVWIVVSWGIFSDISPPRLFYLHDYLKSVRTRKIADYKQ